MKHTPGPWKRGYKDNQTIYGDEGLRVAVLECSRQKQSSHWEANARLIAAAPDLLEAAKQVMKIRLPALNFELLDHPDMMALESAIRKATS